MLKVRCSLPEQRSRLGCRSTAARSVSPLGLLNVIVRNLFHRSLLVRRRVVTCQAPIGASSVCVAREGMWTDLQVIGDCRLRHVHTELESEIANAVGLVCTRGRPRFRTVKLVRARLVMPVVQVAVNHLGNLHRQPKLPAVVRLQTAYCDRREQVCTSDITVQQFSSHRHIEVYWPQPPHLWQAFPHATPPLARRLLAE